VAPLVARTECTERVTPCLPGRPRKLYGASRCGQNALRVNAAGLEWSVNVEAIERVRILHGWTRRDLAHEASVDEGTISDLITGRRRPTFGTLRAVCGALSIGLAGVIEFGPPPKSLGAHSPNKCAAQDFAICEVLL
jgi:DNA-binding Xre family transcriptional regulator